jgi:hypothetical protein
VHRDGPDNIRFSNQVLFERQQLCRLGVHALEDACHEGSNISRNVRSRRGIGGFAINVDLRAA